MKHVGDRAGLGSVLVGGTAHFLPRSLYGAVSS